MLEAYRKKRNFAKTPEPSDESQDRANEPFFVIQKHRASRLHYDFRFLHKGALASWAIPKGPSLDPAEKRLAIRTEDHPIGYAAFEGVIPKGEYGAGEVILWDCGSFSPRKSVEAGLKKGRLHFQLEGEKLHGDFEMIRLGSEDKEQWLLIKHKDKHAQRSGPDITEAAPASVETGRTIEDLRSGKQSRPPPKKAPKVDVEELEKAKSSAFPSGIPPMLPTLVKEAPAGDAWLHEIKWDGYRLLVEKRNDRVEIFTRNRHRWTDRFEPIAEAFEGIPGEFIVDGEAVVLDARGRSDFGALQSWLKAGRGGKLWFYAFDLVYLDGHDLRDTPLRERRKALQAWLDNHSSPVIRFSDHVAGSGRQFFTKACKISLEGVVSKRADSRYQSGRSRSWVKTKCVRREAFIIAGWTVPQGARKHLGSLLLGYYNEAGELAYAGRVGTGFKQELLEDVAQKLGKLGRKTSPLQANAEHVPKGACWVTPELVAEIAYAEMTSDGLLRHASFKGLREDKAAKEIILDELAAEPPPTGEEASGNQSLHGKGDEEETASKASGTEKEPTVAGVRISNPDRKIDPASGATKQELAEYYGKVADHMLPFLQERPLALVRCPQGRHKACFFQKHFPEHAPNGVHLVEIKEKEGRGLYSYVRDVQGIVSLAQYGVIEFHTWGSQQDAPERPNVIVMDLDPDEVPWEEILGAAFLMRDLLDEIGLQSFPKTTGGKGLHVCIPLVRRVEWNEVKPFCKDLALLMTRKNPKRFLAKSSKVARKGKIYIDYLRNGFGASAIAPYSARARPNLPVSVPVDWDELTADIRSDHWTIANIDDRLRTSKAWKDYGRVRQSLTKARLTAFRQ